MVVPSVASLRLLIGDSRAHVPIKIVGPGRAVADDAHRRAFDVGGHRRRRADADADVGGARDHDLQRLAGPLGVDRLERDPVLLEDAGARAQVGSRGFPISAHRDRELERVLGRARRRGHHDRDGQSCNRNVAEHVILREQAWFLAAGAGSLAAILDMRRRADQCTTASRVAMTPPLKPPDRRPRRRAPEIHSASPAAVRPAWSRPRLRR